MWTYNSSLMLPAVLSRISQVVPKEVVARRIIVDDHSKDNTVEIAKKHGWKVYINRGNGIHSAIRTALSLVKTKYFVSFEHDVLLTRNWWQRISRHMKDKSVAVAQGVRIATNKVVRKLDEYVLERRICKGLNEGYSIDNNIYRTSIIKYNNVFRKFLLNHTWCARYLARRGYKWLVDHTVVSAHIRSSPLAYIKHDYFMNKRVSRRPTRMIGECIRRLLTSPYRGCHITWRKHCLSMVAVYVLDRFAILLGVVASLSYHSKNH